ncbi:MAG: 3-dehydroquinate synthase [Clostridia bacterium]|nr:3-dehydroquinate synthase [Clostridia bacterium]
MKTLRVNLVGREYDILIEKNLLCKSGELIKERFSPSKIFIVTDDNVNAIYGSIVTESLKDSGFEVKLVSLTPGEQTKSLEQLSYLYSEALAFSMTRSDMVIALGGGVIGDLTGLMAATLLRGIPFVQIPTTLLAQVDSSVGGKVAIDVKEGKNLVGAFYQPKLVIIDTAALDTLSDRIFFDGLAEVIKYGLIADDMLFNKLENCQNRNDISKCIDDIVYTCCDIKRKVVEEDEHDTGLRMILNFGHTLGHVVEKNYNYETYTHGQAVAYGMYLISIIGEKMNVMQKGTADKICLMLKKFDLPYNIKLADKISDTLGLDKKNDGSNINIVLLDRIGKAIIHKMPLSEFADMVQKEIN